MLVTLQLPALPAQPTPQGRMRSGSKEQCTRQWNC